MHQRGNLHPGACPPPAIPTPDPRRPRTQLLAPSTPLPSKLPSSGDPSTFSQNEALRIHGKNERNEVALPRLPLSFQEKEATFKAVNNSPGIILKIVNYLC